jgi:hypothetical protein
MGLWIGLEEFTLPESKLIVYGGGRCLATQATTYIANLADGTTQHKDFCHEDVMTMLSG